MPNDKYYVPGTFYRICDRTGFKTRSYRTKKEWNGLIVRDSVWEIRQPQDFVKGVADYQAVPEARPRQPDTFIEIVQNTGQFEVYGDLPYKTFLVQNTLGYNAGINAASNYTNTGGTAQMFVTNGTIAEVTASSFPNNVT